MLDLLPGDVGDVDQALDSGLDFQEGPEDGDGGDLALELHPRNEALFELPLMVLILLLMVLLTAGMLGALTVVVLRRRSANAMSATETANETTANETTADETLLRSEGAPDPENVPTGVTP
jgi:hypothetical protein